MMNFNKCSRCGCFFLSDDTVCPNCAPKDQMEMSRLKNYFEENANLTETYQIDHVIACTGISAKNLNRFLAQDSFSNFASQMKKINLN